MGRPQRVPCHECYSDVGVDVDIADGGHGGLGIDTHLRALCSDASFSVDGGIIPHPLRS